MKEGRNKIINSKSKTFLAFCFCFILGVGLFSSLELPGYWLFRLYLLLFIVLFFLIIAWSNKKRRFIILCWLFFVLGGLRYLITIPSGNSKNINYYNGAKMDLVGVISEEPVVKIDGVNYIVGNLSRGGVDDLSGKILLNLPLYPRYNYGDELKITCSLQEPKNSLDGSFNYRQYLARQGVWSICGSPKVTKTSFGQGNKIMGAILWLKQRVGDKAAELWSEPESSFMAGLLYGERNGLPPKLADNFSRTGVSHIIAVSGYNISIVAISLMSLFINLGLARPRAFWLVAAGIILFVIFTGAGASVIRAGIMGLIVLLAGELGRLSRIGNVLVFTAALMLLFNPYVLIWDAGFQLSFLATLGLVYLSPVLDRVIARKSASWRTPKQSHGIATLLTVARDDIVCTLSAIIATLPLILFQFGRLSVAAPFVNLLILWLIPYLMLFGFLAIMLGFIFYPLGQVAAWLAGVGLKYVIITVTWFGAQSWSAVEVGLPLWGMILFYILLTLAVRHLSVGKLDNKLSPGKI